MKSKKGAGEYWWIIIIAVIAIIFGVFIILWGTGMLSDVGEMFKGFIAGQNESLQNISPGA